MSGTTAPQQPTPVKKCPAEGARQRKEQVLELLAQAGGWLSGEKISTALGISRAAVSKHVSALRRAGQVIDSAPRRGFLLRVQDYPPTTDAVLGYLREHGPAEMILGKRIWRCLEETTSTSSEAVAWAVEGAPEGSLVVAERQTRGRGRKGHDWFSAPRGLQFSLILRPGSGSSLSALGQERVQTLFTRMGALAVAEAVRKMTGLRPRLKEPNDVLLDGRKLAGVLVEMGFRGGEPDWLVLGIGCNVNALPEEFPESLREKTCSTLSACGQVLSRPALLAEILIRLNYWLNHLDHCYGGLSSEKAETGAFALAQLDRAWEEALNVN